MDYFRVSSHTPEGASAHGRATLLGRLKRSSVEMIPREHVSIERLSRALDLTHSGTVRLVDRLERDGLVSREKRGARAVSLRLTRRGHRAVECIERARLGIVAELLSALTEEQRQKLDRLLAALLEVHTHSDEDLRRIYRLCSFNACESGGRLCPVSEAVRGLHPVT